MGTYYKKICKLIFSVHHNPKSVMPFQVRLVKKSRGQLDNLPFPKTMDIMGFGHTLEQAARTAWQEKFGKIKKDQTRDRARAAVARILSESDEIEDPTGH